MTTMHDQDPRFEAFIRGRPPMVLINRDRHTLPLAKDVLPPEMEARLRGERPCFLPATRDELERLGIVLAHDHLAAFLKGDPILLIVGAVAHREPLARGRRRKEALERQVHDALAMQVYVGTERLRAWMRFRDGRRVILTIPETRTRALEMLARQGWVDADGLTAAEEERIGFLRAQFDAGSRLVTSWYPWASRPDDLSSIIQRIVEQSTLMLRDPRLLGEAIDREIAMLSFMLRCQRAATRQVLAAHAMSTELRDHDRVARGQLAVLTGASPSRPTLFEMVRAALDGDFDPSNLFRSFLSYRNAFELARHLGRHGRGHDVCLEAPIVSELQRQFDVRAQLDERLAKRGEASSWTDEEAAALTLTQAAWELFSKEKWACVLKDALESGDAVTLTKHRQ